MQTSFSNTARFDLSNMETRPDSPVSPERIVKKSKTQPGLVAAKTEPGLHAAKAQQLEKLKRQMLAAQAELDSMPLDVKAEPADDNAFRDVVEAFAKDTANRPFMIEDSP